MVSDLSDETAELPSLSYSETLEAGTGICQNQEASNVKPRKLHILLRNTEALRHFPEANCVMNPGNLYTLHRRWCRKLCIRQPLAHAFAETLLVGSSGQESIFGPQEALM